VVPATPLIALRISIGLCAESEISAIELRYSDISFTRRLKQEKGITTNSLTHASTKDFSQGDFSFVEFPVKNTGISLDIELLIPVNKSRNKF